MGRHIKMDLHVFILSAALSCMLFMLSADAASPYLTEKPSYLKTCQIKDPQFIKCSTKSIQGLMDMIIQSKGLPGLDALPPLNPFYVKRIKVDQSGTDAINLKIDLSNVVITGFDELKIVESRVSSKDYHWNTKILIPKMTIKGNYVLVGKILLINLNGNGNMTLGLHALNIDLFTTVRLYEKGGFTFYNVTNAKADYTIEKLSARFDNLFNGNKELEESTNLFFNENWQTLNEALQPVIQSTISEILLKYLGAVFHFLPASYFVSDIPTSKELYGE